jgi:hypothetical protein
MNTGDVRQLLAGFEITSCAIRSTDEVALVAQDWTVDDPMEPHETRIFVYKPHKALEEQWGSAGLGTSRAMHVTPSYAPGERWLFVSGTGDIFVVGDGGSDFESPVEGGRGYIWNIKTIGTGSCYLVGPGRKLIERVEANVRRRIDSDVLRVENLVREKGFRDIDGFAQNDLYACGGLGDLWRYDGKNWHFIDLSTNAALRKVCCGRNKVHILVDNRFLLVGRENSWTECTFDDFDDLVGDMAWYRDRLIIVTEARCYEFIDDKIIPSEIIARSPLDFYSYVRCYDDKIFLTSGSQAAFFDGHNWTGIL